MRCMNIPKVTSVFTEKITMTDFENQFNHIVAEKEEAPILTREEEVYKHWLNEVSFMRVESVPIKKDWDWAVSRLKKAKSKL